METLTSLFANPLVNGISLSLAIISIVLAYVFYRRSIRIKEPCWSVRSNNLIRGFGSQLIGLEILYNTRKVEDLTVSRVMIWNAGKETINRHDIVAINHLRIISIENAKLLDVKLLTANNASSQILTHPIEDDGTTARIDFEYLDQSHGAVFQVVHTGTSSENIKVVGDIKGAKKLNNRSISKSVRFSVNLSEKLSKRIKPSIRIAFSSIAIILVSSAYLISGIFAFFNSSTNFAERQSGAALMILGSIMFVFGILTVTQLWLRQPPKGLESYQDDIVSNADLKN